MPAYSSETQSDIQPYAERWRFCDYYFLALGVLLAGYAIVGKAFAYIGIPPLYIGEVALAFGLIAFLISGCTLASLANLPALLLGILFGWAITRVLPYVGEFGIDALRDSVVVGYGAFAFVAAALLLQRPERLLLIVRFLVIVGGIVILVAPGLQMLRFLTADATLIRFTPPDLVGCHLTGAALLMLLGFARVRVGTVVLLLIGMALVSMASRNAMLAMVIPLAVAALLGGKVRGLAVVAVTIVGLIGVAYVLDLSVTTKVDSGRVISAKQLVDNVLSMFGAGEVKADLSATRDWRLEWWKTIADYTLNGPYFWTGKGFGVNLALDDGFLAGTEDPLVPPNRSPHSVQFVMLARTGIPGLTLWLLTLGAWSAMVLGNMVRARMRGDDSWADFFTLIFCYALAIFIAGSFSAGLEGPMLGIWFWCLFGVGIGATMIYRAALRDVGQGEAAGRTRKGA